MITQERLKELLQYNQNTGVFTRISTKKVAKGAFCGLGHRQIMIDKSRYYMHRLAWLYVYGEWPKYVIDHINGVRDDNRIKNLRDVKEGDNFKNCAISKTNTSGVTGVSFIKKHKTWKAYICVDYKLINLGSFEVKDDAISARKNAEIKYGFHKNHGRKSEVNI